MTTISNFDYFTRKTYSVYREDYLSHCYSSFNNESPTASFIKYKSSGHSDLSKLVRDPRTISPRHANLTIGRISGSTLTFSTFIHDRVNKPTEVEGVSKSESLFHVSDPIGNCYIFNSDIFVSRERE